MPEARRDAKAFMMENDPPPDPPAEDVDVPPNPLRRARLPKRRARRRVSSSNCSDRREILSRFASACCDFCSAVNPGCFGAEGDRNPMRTKLAAEAVPRNAPEMFHVKRSAPAFGGLRFAAAGMQHLMGDFLRNPNLPRKFRTVLHRLHEAALLGRFYGHVISFPKGQIGPAASVPAIAG